MQTVYLRMVWFLLNKPQQHYKPNIMKNKYLRSLLLLCLLVGFQSHAQDDEIKDVPKKHEIKINAFNTIVFKAPEFSYEYLLDSESSIGASLMFNLQDNDENIDGPRYAERFALTPYYRRYFSSKYAWGFFLEAFAMYNIQEDYDGYYIVNPTTNTSQFVNSNEKSSNFALGLSLGGKFVSKKGFVFEFFGGVGRNLITSNDLISDGENIVPRIGASLGYRF